MVVDDTITETVVGHMLDVGPLKGAAGMGLALLLSSWEGAILYPMDLVVQFHKSGQQLLGV